MIKGNIMKNINIFVTATPRFELHKECFIDSCKTLIENNFKVNVYVNFDIPEILKNEELDVEKTINYISYINPNIFKYFINKENPDFSLAFEKTIELFLNEQKEENDDIFFWLEDDWKLIDKNVFISSINNFEKSEYDTCTFCNEFPSGPPFLFKNSFFKKIYNGYFKKENIKNLDPEKRFIDCYEKDTEIKNVRYGSRSEKAMRDNSNLPIIFKDMGREWRNKRNIRKWEHKSGANIKTWR